MVHDVTPHLVRDAALDRAAVRLPSIDLSIDGGLLCVGPLGVPPGHFEGGSEGVLLAPDLEPCAISALFLPEPALV